MGKFAPPQRRTSDERALLTEPPTPLGREWVRHVNQPQHEAELIAIRHSIVRDRPFGGEQWTKKVARQLDLEGTMRLRGRPRKEPVEAPLAN